PWHALRTPDTIFSRLNGSTIPERLMTLRLAVSVVEKRRPHSGHWRRRRIDSPSSLVRESMTRLSGRRQKGQTIPLRLPGGRGKCRPLRVEAGSDRVAVRGQILGVAEGPDAIGHRPQRLPVVAHDLLR